MKQEVSSNPLVVQGILKEAFFNQTLFTGKHNDQEVTILITDITENKIREQSENKRVNALILDGDAKLEKGTVLALSAKFFRHTIIGIFCVESIQDAEVTFYFPNELTLRNLRSSERTKVSKSQQKPVPVIIQNGEQFTEAAFLIEDTSEQGFGGALMVPDNFELTLGSKVKGRLGGKTPMAEIEATLVSVFLRGLHKHGYLEYRIGLTQNASSKKAAALEQDARKQSRYSTGIKITLNPTLHPNEQHALEVSNLSINGFAGTIQNDSSVSRLPIGSYFKLQDSSTVVKLVHHESNRVHFEITHRSEEEAMQWLKQMTPLLYPGAQCTVRDYQELYRIFLQAGAVSTQYLKRHQLFHDILIDEDVTLDANDSNIYRWFVRGKNDEIDAHISIFKTADSCWVLGDGVKAADSTIKFSDLADHFFRLIYEFSLHDSSVDSILAFWTHNHPSWANWAKQLDSENQNLISSCKMVYYRQSNEPISGGASIDLSIEDLGSNQIKLRAISERIISNELKKITDYAFGLSQQRHKPYCTELGQRLISLNSAGKNFLGICNTTPARNSINRYLDSLFLFPLDKDNSLSAEEARNIGIATQKLLGVSIPAIRLFTDKSEATSGTIMDCYLIRPAGLLQYKV